MSGPQSSPLLASAVAWTLPLVPAAQWALCLVLPTGMLHPHPLVQVGLGCGLFACDMSGCTCMVDSCSHHSGQGTDALRPIVVCGQVSPAPIGPQGSLLQPVSILLV